jgi:toxin ParE1/3/4
MIQRLPVTFRADAITDLQTIYLIVLERSGNEAVAGGFVQRIMARCGKVGNAPKGGRRRDDLFPGLRTVPFEGRGDRLSGAGASCRDHQHLLWRAGL